MLTEAYSAYLTSPEWHARSADCKARAGYRCQLCNAAGRLHTHHRTYERLGNELGIDLIALCDDCHAKFHEKLPVPPVAKFKQTVDAEQWRICCRFIQTSGRRTRLPQYAGTAETARARWERFKVRYVSFRRSCQTKGATRGQ